MFSVFVQLWGAGAAAKDVPLHIVGGAAVTRCGREVYLKQYSAMAYDAACARYPYLAAKRICANCRDRQNVLEGKPSRAHVRQQAIEQARVEAWNKTMQGERE